MKPLVMALLLGLALAQESGVAQPLNSQTSTRTSHAKSHARKGVKATGKKTVAGKTAAKAADKGHLSTDVNFGDSVLRGQYQAPAEALAKVENEKGFGDLIGVRKHFKDRLAIAADQE